MFCHDSQLKDANKKLVAVKRDQQTQKRKNAQLLEDSRRREGELSSDTHQLQVFYSMLSWDNINTV